MNINKQFKNEDSFLLVKWTHINSYLNIDIRIILILTLLYQENKITRGKLIGQLSSLRKGVLYKKQNSTYHCTINDKWYDHEGFNEVLDDLYDDMGIRDVPVKYIKLIEVLQLYSNKNYNYCINLIIEEIFQPLIRYFSNASMTGDDFNYLILKTTLYCFPKMKLEGYRTECYECGNSHFEIDSRRTQENNIKQIKEFFHEFKKGNLTKIPKL